MAKKRKDPKVGTGKKPKGSDRRLYTDENPKDTVSIKFATPADAKATVAKVKRIKKPFARKIQILTVLEQRAKVSGKNEQATNAIVLRQKFREFLQEFKKYKNKLGVDISILMYDTAQLAGPIAGGITLPPAGRDCSPKGHGTCYGNFDLWVDDDGTPLVDQVSDA